MAHYKQVVTGDQLRIAALIAANPGVTAANPGVTVANCATTAPTTTTTTGR